MTVTVYTKPGCMPCKLTKDWLTRNNVGHLTVDVYASPAAFDYVTRELGYQQMPVVTVADQAGNVTAHWSGLRPDMLATILDTPVAAA